MLTEIHHIGEKMVDGVIIVAIIIIYAQNQFRYSNNSSVTKNRKIRHVQQPESE